MCKMPRGGIRDNGKPLSNSSTLGWCLGCEGKCGDRTQTSDTFCEVLNARLWNDTLKTVTEY